MESFLGFTFKNRHTSEFHILRISPYSELLFGDVTDNYKTILGGVGAYYINTIQGAKPFQIECFFNGMTEKELMEVKKWLYPDEFGPLIFDEKPYLERYVKVSANPVFNFTPIGMDNSYNYTYSGTFTLQFLQVDPFSYAVEQSILSYESKGDWADIWKNNSNILLSVQTPAAVVNDITEATHLLLYNAGNIDVRPEVTASGSGTNIQIVREISDGVYKGNIITYLDNEEMVINNKYQNAIIDDVLSTYRLSENSEWLSLDGTVTIKRYDNAKYTVGIGGIHELTLSGNSQWPTDCKGRYVYVGTDWYKISEYVSTTQVLLESADGLVDETTYNNLVLAYMNDIYVSGDPLSKTLEMTEFNATAEIKNNSSITGVKIYGVAGNDKSGVNEFEISTANAPTIVYSITDNSIFPLFSIPDGTADYIDVDNKKFYRYVEKKTFEWDFCTLVFDSTPITVYNGITLNNVRLYKSTQDINGNTLFELGAPTLYPERIAIYKDGTYVDLVEVDEIDLIDSIGKLYYEYNIINGVPTCSVFAIVASTDSVPTNTFTACFQVSVDKTTYKNVDIIKLYNWFDETPATHSTGKDEYTRVWSDTTELTEVKFLDIDKIENADTSYYVNVDNSIWLIVTKDSATMANLNVKDNLFILYKRLSPQISDIIDTWNLTLENNTDYLIYSATGGQTPRIKYTVELPDTPFSVSLKFNYKYKYI